MPSHEQIQSIWGISSPVSRQQVETKWSEDTEKASTTRKISSPAQKSVTRSTFWLAKDNNSYEGRNQRWKQRWTKSKILQNDSNHFTNDQKYWYPCSVKPTTLLWRRASKRNLPAPQQILANWAYQTVHNMVFTLLRRWKEHFAVGPKLHNEQTKSLFENVLAFDGLP